MDAEAQRTALEVVDDPDLRHRARDAVKRPASAVPRTGADVLHEVAENLPTDAVVAVLKAGQHDATATCRAVRRIVVHPVAHDAATEAPSPRPLVREDALFRAC
jgi:hypothetical protein